LDKFEKWSLENIGRAFLVSLYTRGECERNSRELADRLARAKVAVVREWPDRAVTSGKFYLASSTGEHMQIPIAGPPAKPLYNLLRIIQPRTAED
jgi:hypothetical protein